MVLHKPQITQRMLAPSVLSADFGHLNRDIEMLNNSEADWLHIDIMDGVFVPNISFGFPVLEAIAKVAQKPLDVHLMVEHPDRYISRYRDAGANWVSIHLENNIHADRVLHQIKEAGMKAGIVLNPGTPVESLIDLLDALDYVLLMSVNPGFGGQKFIENTYKKVTRLSLMREKANLDFLIEVDGGVNHENAHKLYEAGADVLVAGNAVFKAPDPLAMIKHLKGV
jgi:ribulose-phosphate 3-epimerase